MDFERISMIIKFARLKKGLTQEEVAKRVRLSTSYITSLENAVRTSVDSAKLILYALGVNHAVLEDSGLHQKIKIEKLQKIPGFKAICCAIDMHCYSITQASIKKILGQEYEYIDSQSMVKIITQIPSDRSEMIFLKCAEGVLPFFIANPELMKNQKYINNKVLENCVTVDPFFMLLDELGIEITNYYKILDEIEKKLRGIRFLSLSALEKNHEELLEISKHMDNIILSTLK